MKKNFVLDTNIVLYDPKAIFSFQENNVYLPIYVLEEVDKFKHEATERGRNARQISRSLDSLRAGGSLNKGSPLPSGGMLFVYAPSTRPQLLSGVDTSTMDSIILQSAIDIRASSPEEETIFITMDVNLRVRADAVGMVAQTYESSSVALDDLDTGVQTIEVEDEDIGTFFQEGKLHLEGLDIPTNTGVNLQGPSDGNSAIGRFDAKLPGVRSLSIPREGVMGIRPRNREQSMALELLLDDKVQLVTLVGKAGTGKSQPITEPILTPSGFTEMGKIKAGDLVVGQNGLPTRVTGVFPQGKLDVYEVSFSDGASTRCSLDHLWATKTSYERDRKVTYKVRTTEEIMNTLLSSRADRRKNHSVPLVQAVEMAEVKTSLNPYLMGILIGDGCLKYHTGVSTSDVEIVEAFRELLPPTTVISYKSGYDYTFKRSQRDNTQHDVVLALKESGLYGCLSNSKFIPDQYLYNSIENRINLLQGLLDSDGTLDYRSGKDISFNSSSFKLVEGVVELVRSLGGIARTSSRKTYLHTSKGRVEKQRTYKASISLPDEVEPFRIIRKKSKYISSTGKGRQSLTRYITDVRLVGSEECQCISVEAEDHLYVTKGFVVTHNTLFALAAALQQTVEQQKYTRILVSRPVMPLGKDIGFLPGSVDEKLNPWMQPIFDNLEFLFSQGKKKPAESVRAYAEIMESGQLQVEPLTYIRGRSLPQQFIIVDEAQNLTPHEVKTIITRAGEGTKIVLTGDPGQIDNPYVDSASNGLTVAANKFRGQSCAGHIVLSQGERSELADLATALL